MSRGLDGGPGVAFGKVSRFGDDRLREECGVFGIFGHEDAAAVTALGLHALQHRGQEGCGIVTYDGSPTYGRPDRLFELCAQHRVTRFGTGAAYLALCDKAAATPGVRPLRAE